MSGAIRIGSGAWSSSIIASCTVVVLERTVLPLRFGAVFSDDDGVATALAMHCDALWEALDRVDGAREWGVKIFVIRMFSTLT